MTLSAAIMSAIDDAAVAVEDGTVPLDSIKQAYITRAQQLLESGQTESQVIAEFNQIANSQ